MSQPVQRILKHTQVFDTLAYHINLLQQSLTLDTCGLTLFIETLVSDSSDVPVTR